MRNQKPESSSSSLHPLSTLFLKVKYYVDDGGWDNVMKNSEYSTQMLYKTMRGQHQSVPRRRVLCGNKTSPRALFVT